MKISVEQFHEAQQKITQLQERLKKSQQIIDQWNACCKKHGEPAAGYEITGFIVAEDGTVDAITRRNGSAAKGSGAKEERS